MKQTLRPVLLILAALVGTTLTPRSALASGVVGTGTAASCTEAALTTALSGGGTVTFNCGGAATITVGSVHPIDADTNIDGGGMVTISSGGTFPSSAIFPLSSGVNFSVDNLTMTNALHGCISGGGTVTVTNSTFSNNDGSLGGTIYTSGTAIITGTTFSGNSASIGGAIFTSGTAIITGSTFSGNSAHNCGGAIASTSVALLTVDNSTFADNFSFSGAAEGGAICSFHTTTITNSTFSGNSSENSQGGAIYQAAGTLTVTSSTFANNHAGGSGAAIYNITGATLAITNSTFSVNSGAGEAAVICFGTVTITNCTFSANVAGGGNVGAIESAGTVTVSNTILVGASGPNCGGPIIDGGNNLDSGATCGFTPSTGSQSNTDPMLDPAGLANNGGPTQTIALCGGLSTPNSLCTGISPAINAGNQGICTAAPVYNLDQRGFGRPGVLATNCSIGAYEGNSAGPGPTPLPTATPTVTTPATPTATTASTVLDHFVCYRTKPTPGLPGFTPVPDVSLGDQFGSSLGKITNSNVLCAPAQKYNEPSTLGAALHPLHLRRYEVGPTPALTPVPNKKVVNQFGTLQVDVLAPLRKLLVPSTKDLMTIPAPPIAPALDHFQCYRVAPAQGSPSFPLVTRAGVSIVDQFGSRLIDVMKPLRLCAPVNKNSEDPTAPEHRDHLMCYKIRLSTLVRQTFGPAIQPIFTANQFANEKMTATGLAELCVPSAKDSQCGDGIVDIGEECDPPSVTTGCSSDCTMCGNGIITPPEICDDNNTDDGDGCSSKCQPEVDHFQCHLVKRLPGAPTPIPAPPFSVEDRYGTREASLKGVTALCNPADKNHEDSTAPTHPEHLTAYRLTDIQPPFVPVVQTVRTQFGTVGVKLLEPTTLLLPSAKSLTSRPTPLASPATDHFLCYTLKQLPQPTPAPVTVEDQFDPANSPRTVQPLKPSLFCAPVNKNGEAPDAPGHLVNLLCYKTQLPPNEAVSPIYLAHQFGVDTVKAYRLHDLCLPAAVVP